MKRTTSIILLIAVSFVSEELSNLITELKKNGVTIVDTMQTYDHGKFVHILDAEGIS